MNENFELENLCQQMETLKKKLEKQEIINDNFIRQSMKKTAGNIVRRYYVIIAVALFVIPYTYLTLVMQQGVSLTFWIGTSVLMLICAGATYYNLQNVTKSNVMSNNLVEVGHNMARAKKFEANWLFFGIPACILWLAWLTFELYQMDSEVTRYMLIGVITGATIGTIIGFKIHFKTQRQYQEIIDQIAELTVE